MRDPYTVLGVARNAAAADIKKAFRKLAKTWHPDQSKDPGAKEKFAEINQAYEILGDEKKRGQFDRGEIDAEGKPRGFEGFGPGGFRPGGGGFNPGGGFHYEYRADGDPRGGHAGFDAGDIFADLFGFGGKRGGQAHARPRGEDVAATATVSLVEAVRGGKTRVIMPTGRTLEVSVPAGIEDGKQIRLKGQGNPGPAGGEAGDALITLRVAKHPLFRIDGRDLRMDLPITLYEAVLGGKVNAPTLDGAVELGVPPGSSSGRTLRLRGKGLPASGGQPAGDLYATLRIVLPAAADADLADLMRRWEKDHRYDPRAGMA